MTAASQSHLAFFLTGRRLDGDLESALGRGLRPALLTAYTDLSRLRYDYPLLLIDTPAGDDVHIVPLAAVIDGVLDKIASGAEGDKIRQQVLLAELEVRRRIMTGGAATLREAWAAVKAELVQRIEGIAGALDRAAGAFPYEGTLIDCDGEAPLRCVRHLWERVQEKRA